MPTQDSIISIPFVAGLNQQLDPDQLQPPELIKAENVVVRRGGRLEKRGGMQLVTSATVFDGSTPALDPSIEALGEYAGRGGTRALLSAGNKLYERVGSDSTHGWRQVNQLPQYLGTLHSVTASGGTVTEIEAMEDSTGTYRVVVWITGQRDGQELSSDKVYREQTPGPGNRVYYAVQYVTTGAFVKAPTVLEVGDPNVTMNLRLTKVSVPAGGYHVGVAYQTGLLVSPVTTKSFSGDVIFHVVRCSDGAVLQTSLLAPAFPLSSVKHACYRAFDVSGITLSGNPVVTLVICGEDSNSNATPAALTAYKYLVNTTTWALTLDGAATNADIALHGVPNPGIVQMWDPWAHRGVVLDQDPPANVLAFAARSACRYYTGVGAPTTRLDGQIIVGKIQVSAAIITTNQAFVPQIGFQTADHLSSVLAGTTNGVAQNHSLSATLAYRMYLDSPFSYSASVPQPPGVDWCQFVVTGQLSDGSTQPYVPGLGSFGEKALGMYQKTIETLEPYHAVETSNILSSGLYPEQLHLYLGSESLNVQFALGQITQINIKSGGGALNAGFTPGVHTGCALWAVVGGVNQIVATVTVWVDAGGHVAELAIESGLPGLGAVGSSITPVNCTQLTGGTPAVGAGTFSGHDCYAYLRNASGDSNLVGWKAIPTAKDYPNTAELADATQYTSFYGDRGFEECVHRWDVKLGSDASTVVLALSSTSANRFTTPNGDPVYGAADPHRQNNFFEVYKWPGAASGPLANPLGGTTSTLIAALGGPWRLVAGLQRVGSTYYCAVSPSGDEFQRNTFLVRIGAESQTVSITTPDPAGKAYLGVTDFKYTNNPGMFVESCNMMRITAPPLNLPQLRVSASGFLCGALRDGSTKGTQEAFVISYDNDATQWRKLQKMNDYTFVNGGVLSVFDGVGANECTSLIWPQADLTSIAWAQNPVYYAMLTQGAPQPTVDPYTSGLSQYQASAFWNRHQNDAWSGYFLSMITRPFFNYEAGFKDKNGFNNSFGNGWSVVDTRWGGDPSKNYESVYTDPRSAQINASARSPYQAGLTSTGLAHYYGRYQEFSSGLSKTSTPFDLDGSLTLWVWAPRTSGAWEPQSANVFNEATSGGDFLLRWTYEYADGTGRMVRSAPSNATKYTICAEIVGAPQDPKNGVPPRYAGGLVTEFRYGFFAPALELTNRLKTADVDSRRVVLQPYTTAEPYGTVCYRVPFGNFRNSQNSFVLPRNSTRGVVAYSIVPWTKATDGSEPLGYVFSNFQCFDGPTGDYNGILSEPFLYTTGNVLDNVPPPSVKAMCVHQNRLVAGGADDPSVIWISKELSPTDAPGFNDALTLTISEGGAVTGLASLNGNLIVFKRNAIFVVPGVMPDSTGYAPSMGQPIKLPAGVGSIDHRSVVETPVGVFFLSERGIEVLYPNLQVEQVGQKVKDIIAEYPNIVSAVHSPDSQEVRFVASAAAGGSIGICYSYQFNVWSTHTYNRTGTSAYSLGDRRHRMALIDGTPWLACEDLSYGANVYRESDTSAIDLTADPGGSATPIPNYVTMTVETAPIDVNQVQGYQRIKRARLLTTNSVVLNQAPDLTPTVQMQLATDYAASGAQTASWTPTQVNSVISTQGRAQLEVHVAEQKGQKLSVRYVEGLPTDALTVSSKGWGLALSNIALVVGLKRGLDKRILPEAKH